MSDLVAGVDKGTAAHRHPRPVDMPGTVVAVDTDPVAVDTPGTDQVAVEDSPGYQAAGMMDLTLKLQQEEG